MILLINSFVIKLLLPLLRINRLLQPIIQTERGRARHPLLLFEPHYHRLRLNGTHDEIVKANLSILAAVPMCQGIQHLIVQPVTGRIQRLPQLKCIQAAALLSVVQFENGLKGRHKD